jgi:hypothetical protein
MTFWQILDVCLLYAPEVVHVATTSMGTATYQLSTLAWSLVIMMGETACKWTSPLGELLLIYSSKSRWCHWASGWAVSKTVLVPLGKRMGCE